MIRRDFFKAALASVAGLLGWRVATAQGSAVGPFMLSIPNDWTYHLPPLPLRIIHRHTIHGTRELVRMKQLRQGDVFTLDDFPKTLRACGDPSVNGKRADGSPEWEISCVPADGVWPE